MRARVLTVLTVLTVLALLATVRVNVALAAPEVSVGSRPLYSSHLTGADEVPARETPAQGLSIFLVDKAMASIKYKLVVVRIENVVAAHIHCGAPGANGPVGVNLYTGGVPGSGRLNGVLAAGTITAPNPGNGCGWATVGDIVAAFNAGVAYVNVHTNDGVAPTNTGPGDFPGGEIRGQVR